MMTTRTPRPPKPTTSFSVIIPWRGGNPVREQLLTNTIDCLFHQDQTNPIPYELIIVEHPQQTGVGLSPIVPKKMDYQYIQLPSCNLPFNKSWAMNVGAKAAKYPYLLFVDGDNLCGERFFQSIQAAMRSFRTAARKCFLCWNWIINLPGKDGPKTTFMAPHELNALCGIWCAEREFYLGDFGGMNENFVGYGGEDNEAYERARYLTRQDHLAYMQFPLVHQYHDWAEPSPLAKSYFEVGRSNPGIITDRLKAAGLGKLEGPTFIDMEVIPEPEPVVEPVVQPVGEVTNG